MVRPQDGADEDLELSVVIPAFNEEGRVAATVRRVSAYLEGRRLKHEIIVVDDGSRDSTLSLLLSLAATTDRLRIVALPNNRGKGVALSGGIATSRGRMVLLSDADLSTPIEEVTKLEAALALGADVAIGSRACAGAMVELSPPWHRVLMGRTFNLMVRALLLPGIHDTQCGFKLFRGPDARALFAAREVDGFAYDVEVLYLARRRGLVLTEVAVRWLHADQSRVSPIRHSAEMFRDLLRLRRKATPLRPVKQPGLSDADATRPMPAK